MENESHLRAISRLYTEPLFRFFGYPSWGCDVIAEQTVLRPIGLIQFNSIQLEFISINKGIK